MREQTYDLVIIGGGVNGVGIARDAAGRGLSVLLCEKDDLASGTSSESTKLIHGGLRYLEHYDFRLVRESLIEREVLLRAAPHIIWPMRFVLPHHKGQRPAWLLRIGLFIYDHLGGRVQLPATKVHRLADSPLGVPLKSDLKRAFEYADCWVDDARLVVLTAVDARDRGAEILTRTEFVHGQRENGVWSVELQTPSGTRQLRARALVNATGPWVAATADKIHGHKRKSIKLRLVKGSHIIVNKIYDGEQAYLFQHADGRVIFTIPYEGQYTLIGTTEATLQDTIENRRATEEEIGYLCELASVYFKKPISVDSVIHTYAGVRPLLEAEGEEDSAVSRDYRLALNHQKGSAPLLSVIGGKITTYRHLAEKSVNRLARLLGNKHPAWSGDAFLPGGDLSGVDFAAFLKTQHLRYAWFTEEQILRLCRSYGSRLSWVLGEAKSSADLGQDFGNGFSAAEVDYLIENEWAVTLEDILWRRTKLGLHLSDHGITKLKAYLAAHPS